MKKYYIFAISLIALFIGSSFSSSLQAAEIISLEGKVQVQFPPEKIWKGARVGMEVDIGDSIRTARRSRAGIALDKERKNTISIEEKTLLILNSLTPGQIDRFDLSHGKIYANVEKIKEGLTYEVSTPSSVTGVRGTGWSVKSDKKRDEVAVYRHKVFVKAFDEKKNLISEITLPEGFKTIVERFQRPGELIELSEREMEHWNELRQEISERREAGPKRDIEQISKPRK